MKSRLAIVFMIGLMKELSGKISKVNIDSTFVEKFECTRDMNANTVMQQAAIKFVNTTTPKRVITCTDFEFDFLILDDILTLLIILR